MLVHFMCMCLYFVYMCSVLVHFACMCVCCLVQAYRLYLVHGCFSCLACVMCVCVFCACVYVHAHLHGMLCTTIPSCM